MTLPCMVRFLPLLCAQVISRAQMGGVGRPLPSMPGAAAAAAGAGPGTDGPSVSVDEILKRPEYQKGSSSSSAAAKGRGRSGGRVEDEGRVMPEAKVKRLLELQGLNKVCGRNHAGTHVKHTNFLRCLSHAC